MRPTPIVALQIRRVVGFGMLVAAGTLFMLYLFRPRPYVLAGAFAWAASSMMLLVLSVDSGGAHAADPNTITTGRLGIGAWSYAALFFGAALRLASGWFRAPSAIPLSMFWAIFAGAAWVIFGAAFFPRPGAILLPALLLMTSWHLISAYGYLKIVRQHRFVGAALAGIGVFSIAVINISASGGGHCQPRHRAGLDQRRLSQFAGVIARHPRHAPADLRGRDRGAARRRRPRLPRAVTR